MKSYAATFRSGTTEYIFEASMNDLHRKAPAATSIIITDETIAALHADKLAGYRVITVPSGEQAKSWETIEQLTHALIQHQAHRKTMLIGIGGGVVTDLTGFLASIYMRGVPFGFVPTTILAMVDASIGGKNGVNVGIHKNMLGVIRQPSFILYHLDFLLTLPDAQWCNGFAEVIKYGLIADTQILNGLSQQSLAYFQKHPQGLYDLIDGCVAVKNKIVMADEQENGLRKVLNFGHTAGHAFETLYKLPHGHAVGLGMLVACKLSEKHLGLAASCTEKLVQLLEKYNLPVQLDYDMDLVLDVLQMDKKRNHKCIDYVLLEKAGVAVLKELEPVEIKYGLTASNTIATN